MIDTTGVNTDVKERNLNQMFSNLNDDIESVNKFIINLNNQKKANQAAIDDIEVVKKKFEQEKLEFEQDMKYRLKELEVKKSQVEKYFNVQKQALSSSEEEFKKNMDFALSELEIIRKETELGKEKLEEEKNHFESYKSIEMEKINHSMDVLESEKRQFDKYKDITNKRFELENKNIEKKCESLKNIVNQFNVNFKPVDSDKNE